MHRRDRTAARLGATWLLALAPLATSALAAAAPAPIAEATPAPVARDSRATPGLAPDAADIHAIDGRHSSAAFIVNLPLRGAVAGRISGVAGALQGNASDGWRVQVRLDAQGLRFDGPRWMERSTRSSSFLAVDRYPSIRFESDRFSDASLRAGGPLQGQLTLRGLRRLVSFALLPSDCARPGQDCDIRVQGSVSRREFGMSAYRALVADRVDLQIRVRLRPDGARR